MKLSYWNIKGRAEVTRLILADLNIKYTEKNPTGESWAEEKK